MKRGLVAAALTALAAILAAGLASAAAPTNGRLIVVNPAARVGMAGNTTITAIPAPNTYRTTVYVPAGYRAAGGLGAVGNNVGKAQVYIKQADGSRVTLNGQLSVMNPTQVAATSCSSVSGTHAAVWMLKANQTKGTGTITFPVYVDTHDTNPNMPASAALTLQWCAGAYSQSISQVDLDLVRMLVNPQARGMAIWRAVYDPASSDGKSALASSSVGALAAVPVGTQVTMKTARTARQPRWVTITGNVTVVNHPLAGVKVQVFVGHSRTLALNRARATVRTKADGSYRVLLRLGKGAWYARAKASAPYRDITAGGGCTSFADNLAAKGCTDATLSPFIVVSNPLKRIL